MSKTPDISNTEWGLVIGALVMCDLFQALLTALGVGVVADTLIDPGIGFMLAFWMQSRGQSLANPKRITGIALAFILELVPIINDLPLWTMDGIFAFMQYRSEKALEKAEEAKQANSQPNNVLRFRPRSQTNQSNTNAVNDDIQKAA